VTNIGDLTPDFPNVLVPLRLSSKLLSVDQLMDYNCDVKFSRSGCLVLKQVLGKMIMKEPKVGRLFLLQFISNHLSFVFCV